ncbi:MAG: hypothetical protein ACXVCY_09575 [Pseudobdellovibrionaceae bacterium]
MNALLRIKKEWEFQNEQYFLRLVETSTDVSVESVKRAGRLASFLMYLVYKLSRIMLALVNALLRGPQLVRHLTPEKPYEEVELSKTQLEFQLMNSIFRR